MLFAPLDAGFKSGKFRTEVGEFIRMEADNRQRTVTINFIKIKAL